MRVASAVRNLVGRPAKTSADALHEALRPHHQPARKTNPRPRLACLIEDGRAWMTAADNRRSWKRVRPREWYRDRRSIAGMRPIEDRWRVAVARRQTEWRRKRRRVGRIWRRQVRIWPWSVVLGARLSNKSQNRKSGSQKFHHLGLHSLPTWIAAQDHDGGGGRAPVARLKPAPGALKVGGGSRPSPSPPGEQHGEPESQHPIKFALAQSTSRRMAEEKRTIAHSVRSW
jgi:hypothetical protein